MRPDSNDNEDDGVKKQELRRKVLQMRRCLSCDDLSNLMVEKKETERNC